MSARKTRGTQIRTRRRSGRAGFRASASAAGPGALLGLAFLFAVASVMALAEPTQASVRCQNANACCQQEWWFELRDRHAARREQARSDFEAARADCRRPRCESQPKAMRRACKSERHACLDRAAARWILARCRCDYARDCQIATWARDREPACIPTRIGKGQINVRCQEHLGLSRRSWGKQTCLDRDDWAAWECRY